MIIGNTAQFKAFRKDVDEALKAVADKYQVKIDCGNITYSDVDFTMKLKVEDATVDVVKAKFEAACFAYGYAPSDYRKLKTVGDTTYALVGFNPKARKNYFIIEDIATGKQYVTGARF